MAQRVTIETTVNAPLATAWETWTKPEHVTKWNHASDDWHSPTGKSDLREGGEFSYRMEAKDKSVGFDFGGKYTKVIHQKQIEYTMGDGRTVSATFTEKDGKTHIVQSFDAESENPVEMQRQGWQAIMDNHKKYAESK